MKYSETTEVIQKEDLKRFYHNFIKLNFVAYGIAILGFLLFSKVKAIEAHIVPAYILTVGMSISIFLSGYLNFKQVLKETHKTVITGEVANLWHSKDYYCIYLRWSKTKVEINAKMYHTLKKGDKIVLHLGMNNSILRYEKI